MKNAPPHTGNWIREWFPEQTKNIPTILLWTIVYILDTVLVFWLAHALGINLLRISYRLQSVLAGLYMVIALVLFWLETRLYSRILNAIRQSRTLN